MIVVSKEREGGKGWGETKKEREKLSSCQNVSQTHRRLFWTVYQEGLRSHRI